METHEISPSPKAPLVTFPTERLGYQGWLSLLQSPENHWAVLMDEFDATSEVDNCLALWAKDKLILKRMQLLGFPTDPSAVDERLRKCLLLLHATIDPSNLSTLYGIDQTEVILGAMPLTDDSIPKEAIEGFDLSMSVFYSVAENLALNLCPKEPFEGIKSVLCLTKLNLNQHQLVLDRFAQTHQQTAPPTIH